jgi:hypothetical protein
MVINIKYLILTQQTVHVKPINCLCKLSIAEGYKTSYNDWTVQINIEYTET